MSKGAKETSEKQLVSQISDIDLLDNEKIMHALDDSSSDETSSLEGYLMLSESSHGSPERATDMDQIT